MRRRVPLTGAFVTCIVRDGVRRRSVRHKRLLPAWERKGNPLRPRPRAPGRGPRRDTGRPLGERMGHTVRPLDECAHHAVRPLAMLSNGKHAKAVCLPERKRAKSRIYTIPLSQPVAAPSAARPAGIMPVCGPCRGPPSAARPASRSRSHVPTSGAALRSEPVGIIPAFGSRCHPIGGIPACAPPHARSHHPCGSSACSFAATRPAGIIPTRNPSAIIPTCNPSAVTSLVSPGLNARNRRLFRAFKPGDTDGVTA